VALSGQNWELLGDVIVIRMTPKYREKFRAAVEIWEETNPQIDLQKELLIALTRMIPTEFRGPISTISDQPDSEFARASYPAIGWPNRTSPALPPGRVDHMSDVDVITRQHTVVRVDPSRDPIRKPRPYKTVTYEAKCDISGIW